MTHADSPDITSIGTFRTVIGEGPMWSARDQSIYWLDTVQKKILRHRPAVGGVDMRDLHYRPSCLSLLPDGRFVIAFKKGLAYLDFETGGWETIPAATDIDFDAVLFNDGAVDRTGRMWIGTMDKVADAAAGGLYRVDPDFTVTRHADKIRVSNGMAWSPDGRTMYHADSRPGCIYAMDFDAASATVANRRPLIEYGDKEGRPDGCTVDAEGFIWVAEVEGSKVARYAPDGRLDRQIRLPVLKPTSVMFGGPDLSTLYVTSMTFRLSAEQLAAQPCAGTLLAVDAGVRGLCEPVFGVGA